MARFHQVSTVRYDSGPNSLIHRQQYENSTLKACTHRDKYRRALFASVFQRVFGVHTQAIFADDERSEHANSFPDIRWRLM